jgi:CII-binding regulator of phage lambda lysogenization HflD
MEIINQVANMISQYGLFTVLSAVGLGLLIWKGKEIGSYIVTTLQASALVKKNEETIAQLRAEIQELREKLEMYNTILTEQTATIARLEERIIHAAKTRVSRKKPTNENQ